MTFPPEIEINQNADVILARMKSNDAMIGIDTSPNSPMNMALAPVSIELAEAYRQLEAMLWRNRLVGPEGEVASGDDLDAVGDERGIYRLPGIQATGIVRFLGPSGTAIAANTVVTTLGPNVRRYTTDAAVVIPVGEEVDVAATAIEVGTSSNVPAGAIQLLEIPITRTRVTNPDAFRGGVDVENDDAYRARVVEFVRDPPNGSNPAQYRKWARDIPGVGGAITLRPGEVDAGPPGTVDLYIVNALMLPAEQALVDAVQDYIAPPRIITVQAEVFTIGNANGVSNVSQPGATGQAVRLAYSAAGQGEIHYRPTLVQGGNWTARVRLEASAVAGTTSLLQIHAYNVTGGVIAPDEAGHADGTSSKTLRAVDMSLTWVDFTVPFYWNGTDIIELYLTRLATDTTTEVFVDSVTWRSRFSNYELEGLAPILDEVRVKPAIGRPIDVAASIHIQPGYAWTGTGSVQSLVAAALNAYLREQALANATSPSTAVNDIIYGEIGAVIQATPGVDYYDPVTLRVNGATANISVAKREVAVPGVYTFTQI